MCWYLWAPATGERTGHSRLTQLQPLNSRQSVRQACHPNINRFGPPACYAVYNTISLLTT
jgi:hypothetical protein